MQLLACQLPHLVVAVAGDERPGPRVHLLPGVNQAAAVVVAVLGNHGELQRPAEVMAASALFELPAEAVLVGDLVVVDRAGRAAALVVLGIACRDAPLAVVVQNLPEHVGRARRPQHLGPRGGGQALRHRAQPRGRFVAGRHAGCVIAVVVVQGEGRADPAGRPGPVAVAGARGGGHLPLVGRRLAVHLRLYRCPVARAGGAAAGVQAGEHHTAEAVVLGHRPFLRALCTLHGVLRGHHLVQPVVDEVLTPLAGELLLH